MSATDAYVPCSQKNRKHRLSNASGCPYRISAQHQTRYTPERGYESQSKGMLCKIVSWVCDRPVAGAIGMCISVVSVSAVLTQIFACESCKR